MEPSETQTGPLEDGTTRSLKLRPSCLVLVITIVLFLSLGSYAHPDQQSPASTLPTLAKLGHGVVPFQPGGSSVPYDEQVGMTFTQNLPRLDFNVTAVEQTDNGVGPAYLINGLTAANYWYQVGLSWRWPSNNGATLPGFNMNYEVFDTFPNSCGGSIYPANCAGGGVESITVNPGDIVLLSLSFSKGNVIMGAMDWNTGSSANQTYSAVGQTQFIGLTSKLEQNGFFTGLMTEQYHSNPFNGTGTPVRYSSTNTSLASAWLWMDEGDTNTPSVLFSDNTTTPVQLNDSTGAYFTSHGTAEIGNSHGLVTGITPAAFPTANPGSATGYSNHQASVSIKIGNSTGAKVNFLNVTIVANFTTYHISSPGPTALQGTGTYNLTVILPFSVSIGNYTLRIDVSSWQYQEPESQEWIQLQPASFNETLRVTSAPQPANPTPRAPGPPGPNLPVPSASTVQASSSLLSQLWAVRVLILPAVIGYLALLSLAVIMVVRRGNTRRSTQRILSSTACQVCGNPISLGSSACPICGKTIAMLESS